eukprot:8977444-Prorocentrum_lima.AAC.1
MGARADEIEELHNKQARKLTEIGVDAVSAVHAQQLDYYGPYCDAFKVQREKEREVLAITDQPEE